MVIIGFSGKMGSGKNYLAESIIAPFLKSQGAQVLTLAFADQLKIEVMTKYNLSYDDVFEKKTPETRAILQNEGTENGRDKRGSDIWIKYLSSWIQIFAARGVEHFLITDVRFKNEAEWIKQLGGILVKIDASDRHESYCLTRSISSDRQHHISEIELDGWTGFDITIDNSMTNSQNVDKCLKKMISDEIKLRCDTTEKNIKSDSN
jgi:hypothetical protein